MFYFFKIIFYESFFLLSIKQTLKDISLKPFSSSELISLDQYYLTSPSSSDSFQKNNLSHKINEISTNTVVISDSVLKAHNLNDKNSNKNFEPTYEKSSYGSSLTTTKKRPMTTINNNTQENKIDQMDLEDIDSSHKKAVNYSSISKIFAYPRLRVFIIY